MDNKDLLESLMSLSIQGAKEELQRQIDRGEINPTFLAQVTAMLKHHEVKADIRDKKDLRTMGRDIKANRDLLLGKVTEDLNDVTIN